MKDKFSFLIIAILFFGIGSLVTRNGYAQDCSTSLRDAQHSYEAGDFRKVIDILSPCVESHLNSDDSWRGYRLMSISYLYLDNSDSADICIRAMLSLNPLYTANPGIDPDEFIKALSVYQYFPKFSIGAQVGFLDPVIKLLSANTVTQVTSTQGDYSSRIGTALGLNFEFHIIHSLGISIAGILTPEQFSRDYQPVIGKSVTYTETISSNTFPLILHLDLTQSQIKPFIEGGAFIQFISSATGSLSFNGSESTNSTLGTSTLSLDRRKTTNYGFLIGAGVAKSFTSPLSEIRLSARYWNGMRDMTRPEARYTTPALYQNFYYIDDEIAFHGIELSFNFIFHLSLSQYRINE